MKKPSGLYAVCITGMVLAVVFLCCDTYRLFGQAATAFAETQAPYRDALTAMPAGREARAFDDLLELQRAARPALIVAYTLDVLVAMALLASAAMALALVPAGRTALTVALLGALGSNVASTAIELYVEWRAAALTRAFMRDAVATDPTAAGGPGGIDAMLQTYLGASLGISLACAGVWLALKASYYVAGVVYLHRESTRALFRRDEMSSLRSAGMPRG